MDCLSNLEKNILSHIAQSCKFIEQEKIMIEDHYKLFRHDLLNDKGCAVQFSTYKFIVDRITRKGMLAQSYNPLSFYSADISLTEKGLEHLGIN